MTTPPETPPAPPTGPTPPATGAPNPSTEPPPPAAQPAETDWKAEARKWESRAKENSGAAKRLAELEEANKTEAQKLADRATKAEKAAETAQTEALRWRIATRHGIGDEDAETFLTGATEEALTKQAERLVVLRTPQQAAPAAGGQRTPVEALRPGALPNPPEPTLADQIATAEKAGDWAKAQQLKAQQLMTLADPNQ